MPTLTETLDRIPPCLVRLLARNGHSGRRLTLHGIADRSGLSYGCVMRLAMKRTWAGTTPKVIDAFTSACGVDLLRPSRKLKYLRRVLKDPRGYRKLATESGKGCPASVLRLLQSLS